MSLPNSPGPRHDVERPQQLAAQRVEAAHVLGRRFLLDVPVSPAPAVLPVTTTTLPTTSGPVRVVEAPGERLVLVEVQARASLVAEAGDGLAGLRVERVEILAANREDALVGVAGAAAPVVDAARRRAVRFFARPREELLLPDGLAGLAVERDDQAVRVLGVEHAVDHDRRRPQVVVHPADRETPASAGR